MKSYFTYNLGTPLNEITILVEGDFITEIRYGEEDYLNIPKKHTALSDKACEEIKEYLNGKRDKFSLPLKPKGTEFQLKIWNELIKVPYGKTKTYKQLAEAAGHPKAARAAGGGCNKNPIAIVIPCHRIVGSNNSLTGYAGGLSKKHFLLKLEETE